MRRWPHSGPRCATIVALAALDASQRAARIDGGCRQQDWHRIAGRALAHALPPIVRDGEARRIASVLGAWLDLELDRPAFTLTGDRSRSGARTRRTPLWLAHRSHRCSRRWRFGHHRLQIRSSDGPKQWFDERPRASATGHVCAGAARRRTPHVPLRAVAYAQLKPDAIKAIGLAADPVAWPALTDLSKLERFRRLECRRIWWRVRLGALAREIASGLGGRGAAQISVALSQLRIAGAVPHRFGSACRRRRAQTMTEATCA